MVFIHPLKPLQSRGSEKMGPKRANEPPHRSWAVEGLLAITLEMHGIFCAEPRE